MKYKLNPAKIFKRKCDNDTENIKGDSTYFCSELVASAYKNMGILPKDISASQYWPGSFSNSGKLELLENARLENEVVIDFSSENQKKTE